MSEAIKKALLELDRNNDDNWTADGLPRLDVVKQIAGDPTVSREKINSILPGFTRTSDPEQPNPFEAKAVEGEGTQDEGDQETPEGGEGGDFIPSVEGRFNLSELFEGEEVVLIDAKDLRDLSDQEFTQLFLDVQGSLEESEKALRYVQRMHNSIAANMDNLILEKDRRVPKASTTNTIQEYLASQKKVAEDRVRRAQLLLEAGVPKQIAARIGKAPIDASRMR